MAGGMVSVPFGHARVSRLLPALPPEYYKTFGMSRPLASHWRPATCEEADCDQWRHGWVTTVDLATDLGQRQAAYIRADRSRRCSEQRAGLTLVKFVYGPGFPCFRASEHRAPVARPPRFLVAGGDWRGNPRGVPTRVHRSAEDWADEFLNHQDRLATAVQRG